MGIADKSFTRQSTNAVVTDLMVANTIEDVLAQQVHGARKVIRRITNLIKKAPGGWADVATAMGTSDATEAQAIITILRNLIDTHKAEFSPNAPDPLA